MMVGVGLLATPSLAGEVNLGTEAEREAGKRIYMDKCAQCHGEDGDGAGVAKEQFTPQPRDFTSCSFKIRTTPGGELPSDSDIIRVIRKGMPLTGMPPWPNLTDVEMQNLVYHIKTYCEDFEDEDAIIDALAMPTPPPATKESVVHGRLVYEENSCADCHGDSGRGDGESAPTLADDWDEIIRPADLTARWKFRGGGSRSDIYRTFTTGLNGTPMPSYEDSIDEASRWALVDYIVSLSSGEEPDFGTVLVAKQIGDGTPGGDQLAALAEAPPTRFPLIGQVIEPGRRYQQAVTHVEARAVYDDETVSIEVSWSDILANTTGSNSPEGVEGEEFSDAVGIQLPAQNPAGHAKPYFLLGDKTNPVHLLFADLAKQEPEVFVAKGSSKLSASSELSGLLKTEAFFEKGLWRVVFSWPRRAEGAMELEEGAFSPMAFALWEGFNKETGTQRGVSSWFDIYLEPGEKPSPWLAAGRQAGIFLLFQLCLVAFVWRKRKQAVAGGKSDEM